MRPEPAWRVTGPVAARAAATFASLVLLLGIASAAGDSGVVSLQRVHTGDLGNLIAVDLDLDGTRSRWLLDTGANRHLVTPAFARRHALVERGRTSADSAFARLEGPLVELPPTLRLGSLELGAQQAMVLDLTPLAGSAAEGIDGVLGAPWFERMTVDLDLRAWTLRAHDGAAEVCPDGLVEAPLERRRGLPLLTLRVDDGAGERALLDTGHAGSLLRVDDDGAPVRQGIDVPGLPATVARAGRVAIAGLVRLDVPLTHLRSTRLRRMLPADTAVLVGVALLDGARLQLQFGRQAWCLEQGQRRLPGGFGLGVALDAQGGVLDAVYPTSPAAEAGLRAGDRVRRWNGQPLPPTADALWAAVHDRDELTLTVEREGTERTLTLRRAWFLPLSR